MASAFLILLAFAFLRTRFSTPLVLFSVTAVSALRFIVASPMVSPADVGILRKKLPIDSAEVVGRVCGNSKFHSYRSGTRGICVFPVRCEGICISTNWKRQRGNIDVCMLGVPKNFSVSRGARVLLHGELHCRSYPGGNPIELRVISPEDLVVLSGSIRPAMSGWIGKWRHIATKRLDAGIAQMPIQQAVLKALILGDRERIPPETYACFRRTGTLHIFAISGLHVGIVGLLLAGVLGTMGISRTRLGLWLIPLLFFYVVSTGMKSSALRALVMSGMFFLAPMFHRKPDIPTSIAFAAILLLFLHPQELLSAGFVLSFLIVSFLVMIFSTVPREWICGGGIRNYFISLLIGSVAANMASMPLTALFFGTFSPISLVGNLVVVPLTFCIVLSGWLSILLPMASEIFSHSAVVFINLMLGSVQGLDAIPGTCWQVDAPPFMAVVLWYVCLAFFFTHARGAEQRVFSMVGAVFAILWTVMG